MNEMCVIRNLLFLGLSLSSLTNAAVVTGEVRDAGTGRIVAARLYIQGQDGFLHHAKSKGGAAIPYKVQRGQSIEVHTTLSAAPFEVELPAGTYTFTAERGKEYHPAEKVVTVAKKPVEVALTVKRWTTKTLASRGWFSGDTHVHRPVDELPALMLAEDLNVGLPLTSWVTDSRESPNKANKNPKPVPPAELIKALALAKSVLQCLAGIDLSKGRNQNFAGEPGFSSQMPL